MVLEREAYEAIVRHAARAYPHECCGAIVGVLEDDRRLVHDAWPMANAAEAPGHRFAVAPGDYRQLEDRARESGVALLGFYHAHPDRPAAPSGYDLSYAWPHFSYVIVSVEAAVPASMTCWRLRDDRSGFDSEEITWPPAS